LVTKKIYPKNIDFPPLGCWGLGGSGEPQNLVIQLTLIIFFKISVSSTKRNIFGNLCNSYPLFGIRYEFKIFTMERALKDVSFLKISAVCIIAIDQNSPLKNEFLTAMGFSEIAISQEMALLVG